MRSYVSLRKFQLASQVLKQSIVMRLEAKSEDEHHGQKHTMVRCAKDKWCSKHQRSFPKGFAILLVYRRCLCIFVYFCHFAICVPCNSWFSSHCDHITKFFYFCTWELNWDFLNNLQKFLYAFFSLHSQLQCAALTFVSYIGDCNHSVARLQRRKHHYFLRSAAFKGCAQ